MATFTQQQLEAMGLKELQTAFQQATGKASKAPNNKFLIKGILEAQKDDSQEPDPDPLWEQHEAKLAKGKAAGKPEAAPEPQAEAAPEAKTDSGDGYVNPFEGMTPQQIIEAAKAKGKAKVEASKRAAKQAKTGDEAATDAPAKPAKAKKDSDGLADMDAAALQAIYMKEIGRPTGSTNTGYLIWKIREARKGNIKVGPAKERAAKSDKPVKVIPIRIEEDALAAMDALIGEGKPYASRMDIFRKAIAVWADMAGHSELSSLIVGSRADDQTHSHTGL